MNASASTVLAGAPSIARSIHRRSVPGQRKTALRGSKTKERLGGEENQGAVGWGGKTGAPRLREENRAPPLGAFERTVGGCLGYGIAIPYPG